MTIEQLRTLRAVAAEGSFSAAARKLGRVQAAVSQAIDRLEAQLGLRLFDRTARVPRLTKHGEAVLLAAARVNDEVEALDELVASLKSGAETRVSIAVDVMFPVSALVTFAREFSREHPQVELVLFSEALSAVTAQVREKRATLGIAGDEADLTGLERRGITDVRLLPVATAAYPLARLEGAIDDAAVAKAVQIVLSERAHAGDRETPDHGVLSQRTWRVADLATKHALIRGGLGWGHLPEHLVRRDLRTGRLVELRIAAWGAEVPRRSLLLVRRRGTAMGPVAQWVEARLVQLCRDAIEPEGGEGNHAE